MRAIGATPADQARSLGLVVGDTIEGSDKYSTARLTLLWIGNEAAVWVATEKSAAGAEWSAPREMTGWNLRFRDWIKVEVQR